MGEEGITLYNPLKELDFETMCKKNPTILKVNVLVCISKFTWILKYMYILRTINIAIPTNEILCCLLVESDSHLYGISVFFIFRILFWLPFISWFQPIPFWLQVSHNFFVKVDHFKSLTVLESSHNQRMVFNISYKNNCFNKLHYQYSTFFSFFTAMRI